MRKALVRVGVVLLAAGAGFAARGCSIFERPVTVTSLSPDDAHRVAVVELPAFIDRNFEVRLEGIGSGQVRTVFRSPDEGRPVGSERVVWAADGSRFLLLGRHFFVTDAGKLPSGEQAYLMVDVRSGQLWCNASQQRAHAGFGPAELRAVRWLGWAPDASTAPGTSGEPPR
ncbi:MAG: hypothetical protein ACRCZF_04750 [Gemmataceae bacterium]